MNAPSHQPPKLVPRHAWPFYRDHFIKGFCRYLPLPLVLLFLLAVAMGWFGTHFGIYYLIWHEEPWQQFLVGFVMILLACRIFFLAYLLETQNTPPEKRYELPISGPLHEPLFGHLVGMLVAAVVSVLAVYFLISLLKASLFGEPAALLDGVRGLMAEPPPYVGLLFLAGAVLSALLFVILLALPLLFKSLQEKLEWVGDFATWLPRRFAGAADPFTEDRYLHGIAFVSFVFAFAFYVVVGLLPGMTPIIALCFLLDAIISIFGFVTYFLRAWLALVVLVLGLLILFGGLPRYKNSFPGMEQDYNSPQPLAEYVKRLNELPSAGAKETRPWREEKLLQSKDIKFTGWEAGPHKAGEKRPLVIVCVSGGGIRSAAWSVAVLQAIEERFYDEKKIHFPHHIRLITGASGGMLGASHYTALIEPPDKYKGPDENQAEHYQAITADSLTPTVRQMAYGDLGWIFLPAPAPYDRGRALEEAWGEQLGERFKDATFKKFREGEEAGWRPSLVFSPMLIEDGRRLLISNLDLSLPVQNDCPILRTDGELDDLRQRLGDNKDNTLSFSAYEFFRLFPHQDTYDHFRISTAARMSASFPYISPAVPLPTEPRRRVVDAGYFDNYGVSLAAAWLFSGSNRQWLRDHVSGVVLIQIRDGLYQNERMLTGDFTDNSTPFSRGLEWLTSPPVGLYHSTTSASALRNDELLEVLNRLLEAEQGPDFFTTITFELDQPASLSWYLTEDEREVIRNTATGETIQEQIGELLQWWERKSAADGK